MGKIVIPRMGYRSLALTLSAIALYIPANLYPFMTMSYGGMYRSTTIWDGITTLFDEGMWATAAIVFAASIIIPILKLLCLLIIIFCKHYDVKNQWTNSLVVFIDFIGRWSMLDVFLLAIMVALIKFGSFATVNADLSSYLFGFVVIFTMLASAYLRKDFGE